LFEAAAAKRGLAPKTLLKKIMLILLDDNLLDAVIDDGAESKVSSAM
jgi:hypothetical protein